MRKLHEQVLAALEAGSIGLDAAEGRIDLETQQDAAAIAGDVMARESQDSFKALVNERRERMASLRGTVGPITALVEELGAAVAAEIKARRAEAERRLALTRAAEAAERDAMAAEEADTRRVNRGRAAFERQRAAAERSAMAAEEHAQRAIAAERRRLEARLELAARGAMEKEEQHTRYRLQQLF